MGCLPLILTRSLEQQFAVQKVWLRSCALRSLIISTRPKSGCWHPPQSRRGSWGPILFKDIKAVNGCWGAGETIFFCGIATTVEVPCLSTTLSKHARSQKKKCDCVVEKKCSSYWWIGGLKEGFFLVFWWRLWCFLPFCASDWVLVSPPISEL